MKSKETRVVTYTSMQTNTELVVRQLYIYIVMTNSITTVETQIYWETKIWVWFAEAKSYEDAVP